MTPDWPRGGYAAGDTPASELKPPPPNMVSKQTVPDRSVTPDLPIPEAARQSAAAELYGAIGGSGVIRWSDVDHPAVRKHYLELADLIIAAALPHLRSLQVETQVEYGRALGRKEAANQIKQLHKSFPFGKTCPECHTAWPCTTAAACLDLEYPGQNATSEPRTDLPVGPSHPQDSKTATEPPECDCRYGHQPQFTKHEHTCSWGRWHLIQEAWKGEELPW